MYSSNKLASGKIIWMHIATKINRVLTYKFILCKLLLLPLIPWLTTTNGTIELNSFEYSYSCWIDSGKSYKETTEYEYK